MGTEIKVTIGTNTLKGIQSITITPIDPDVQQDIIRGDIDCKEQESEVDAMIRINESLPTPDIEWKKDV